jgi:hypothetical protein
MWKYLYSYLVFYFNSGYGIYFEINILKFEGWLRKKRKISNFPFFGRTYDVQYNRVGKVCCIFVYLISTSKSSRGHVELW